MLFFAKSGISPPDSSANLIIFSTNAHTMEIFSSLDSIFFAKVEPNKYRGKILNNVFTNKNTFCKLIVSGDG